MILPFAGLRPACVAIPAYGFEPPIPKFLVAIELKICYFSKHPIQLKTMFPKPHPSVFLKLEHKMMARKFPTGIRPLLFSFVLSLVAAIVVGAGLPDTALSSAPPPIRSAAEIDYPPFSYAGPDGRATGFSVELLRAALAAMDREVTFKTGPWADVRGWLEKGEIDALPLVGRTPERESLFDFTVPYMSLHGAIVVRKGNVGKI